MSRFSIVVGIMLGLTAASGAVSAQTITAFDLATAVPGNQSYGGTVGVAFTVNAPISVSALGAFDAAIPNTTTPHTLNGTILTSIYDSTTQVVVPGLTATFTAASPGTLVGGFLFKPTGGILLLPGSYIVTFTSPTASDQLGNSTVGAFGSAPTYNEGGNLISINKTQFQYSGTTGSQTFPNAIVNGQLDAGSFQFKGVLTPEPGAVSLFGSLVVMGGSALLRRRRLRK
jgi:hypothetical protein